MNIEQIREELIKHTNQKLNDGWKLSHSFGSSYNKSFCLISSLPLEKKDNTYNCTSASKYLGIEYADVWSIVNGFDDSAEPDNSNMDNNRFYSLGVELGKHFSNEIYKQLQW